MRELFASAKGELGSGDVVFAWSPRGAHLAAAGNRRAVVVYDRDGRAVAELALPPPPANAPPPADARRSCCLALEWDADGDTLAILPADSAAAYVWLPAAPRELKALELEIATKQATALAWARDSQTLAVATSKGGLQLFAPAQPRRAAPPVVGRHAKRVACGAWAAGGVLALGGADRAVTLTDGATGDALASWQVKGEPCEIAAAPAAAAAAAAVFGAAGGGACQQPAMFSVVTSKQVLYVLRHHGRGGNGSEAAAPMELSLSDKHGACVKHLWLDASSLAVMHDSGRVAIVAVDGADAGAEVLHARPLDALAAAAYCPSTGRLAVAGGAAVRVLDARVRLADVPACALAAPAGALVGGLAWARGGQVLTVATRDGRLITYLASLPAVFASAGARLVHLTSLSELTIVDVGCGSGSSGCSGGGGNGTKAGTGANNNANAARTLAVDCEPEFVAAGPRHVAVGFNNRVTYYHAAAPGITGGSGSGGGGGAPAGGREHPGAVAGLWLSSTHAAALVGGRLLVHALAVDGGGCGAAVQGGGAAADMQLPPPPQAGDFDSTAAAATAAAITCAGITDEFVVTGSAAGAVCHYVLPGLEKVAEYGGGGSSGNNGSSSSSNNPRHKAPIRHVWPQPGGVWTVFEDAGGALFLLDALEGAAEPLAPLLQGGAAAPHTGATAVLWDCQGAPEFAVAFEGYSTIHALLAARPLTDDAVATHLAATPLPRGHAPVVLVNGVVTCRLAAGGALDVLLFDSHVPLQGPPPPPPGAALSTANHKASLPKRFAAALRLRRLDDAWACAAALRTPLTWRELGAAALANLDVEGATAAYREAGDAAMVLSLAGLEGIEDRWQLAGHALALLHGAGRADAAQDALLRGPRPLAALELRRDLGHWPQALALAKRLAPRLVPVVCRERAEALESAGDYAAASAHYQEALGLLGAALDAPRSSGSDGDGGGGCGDDDAGALRVACVGGVARCALRLGDVAGGKAAALSVDDPALWRACAEILDSSGGNSSGSSSVAGAGADAAELYARAGLPERAAAIYIAAGDLGAAAPLMARVRDARLLSAYASACESQARWAEAATAYEAARDVAAAARVLIERLNDVPCAAALVRAAGPGGASAAAAAVARACLAARDGRGAAEFLLLAGDLDHALDVAAAHGAMDAFTALLHAGAGGPVAAEQVAAFFERRGELEAAGDAWARAGRAREAATAYARAGTLQALFKAVELVERCVGSSAGAGAASAADLAAPVLEALAALPRGDGAAGSKIDSASRAPTLSDGGGANANQIDAVDLHFRLLVAAGRPADAARCALDAAKAEQDGGHYRAAHARLVRVARAFSAVAGGAGSSSSGGGGAPRAQLLELSAALALLHSYVLARARLTLADHQGAARLLARVAASAGRFPAHAAAILTSAAVECQRAGLPETAREHALAAMRPEHRRDVPERYRQRVELLVRRPDPDARDAAAVLAPCAFCDLPGPAHELQCAGCRGIVPFDIATGMRATLADWAECPACRFPCSQAAMRALLLGGASDGGGGGRCPLCCERVEPDAVARVPDARAALARTVTAAAGSVPAKPALPLKSEF